MESVAEPQCHSVGAETYHESGEVLEPVISLDELDAQVLPG